MNHLPADLMALALAFLLPSGSALVFSIEWQAERAWMAVEDDGTLLNCFYLSWKNCATTEEQLIPADSLEKTPKACVLSTHLIFIPPSLKADKNAHSEICI